MITNSMARLDRNTLIAHKDQFNLELKNNFSILENMASEDVEIQYNNIRSVIQKASLKVKPIKRKLAKLSIATQKLIEDRQKLTYYTPEYRNLDKQVKRCIRSDIRKFNINQVQEALERNKSLKIAKQGINQGKATITCLKDKTGLKHRDRSKITDICTEFYKNLYSKPENTSTVTHTNYSPENIEPITGFEVHRALSGMKYHKSPGVDGITAEELKIGEFVITPHITNFFNSILLTGSLPQNFCHSKIKLLYKKGDKSAIGNYRPISLVSHLYKAFIKVIENRIAGTLESHQPPEQAGFRRGLSTTDHLHSINQLIEKSHEFRFPLYIAFIDYSKAFDSITHQSLFEALENQHIARTYIQLLQNIYTHSTAAINIHTNGPSFHIDRGVKQGDPLSPKLFNAILEEVFKKLAPSWGDRGIVIGEKRLTNLRFADDIVLFSSTASELQKMLQDLSQQSREVGLCMNMSKTKIMTNHTQQKISIDSAEIGYVQEYIYLGQIVSFQARQEKEVARRITNAWKSYWALKDLMTGTLPMHLKRRLLDICILPILTYGAQTWSLTIEQRSALAVCQRAMERSILGVKLIDRIRNTELRSQTKIIDVTQKAGMLKWDWAGHVCRMPDQLWAKTTTDWVPEGKRPPGRPRKRWKDELYAHNKDWPTIALDRNQWREGREAFAQLWDNTG